MDIYARARKSSLSWQHDIPLPTDAHAFPKFQSWYSFDRPTEQWVSVSANQNTIAKKHIEAPRGHKASHLLLLTWNIDSGSPRPQERVAELFTFIVRLEPKVDIIFLQEVSKPALQQILGDERIREHWTSSEHEEASCKGSFTTMILVSKARFTSQQNNISGSLLGPIWRVALPSHFGRDALFCDILVPSPQEPTSTTRVRLANVHLDSLPIKPSHRPQQLSIVSSFLRSAGCGLAAGDFNPVLEDDGVLIESNGMSDAWTALHSEDGNPGYTWGVDGNAPFPPNRMDKVALLGLKAHHIETLEPQRVGDPQEHAQPSSQQTQLAGETLPWSDHHGLLCSFSLEG